MPRVFDNIQDELLPVLRATLTTSKRADFCVGYFNLRGWQSIDDLIQPWIPEQGQQCRVLIGMQRPSHDEVRDLYRAASGCCRVLIVWDVQPRWGRPDGAIQDSKDIRQKLGPHGLANHPCVFLVPIKAELEAWLLADGRALSQVLSRPEHRVRIHNTSNVESQANPKKRLENIFQRYGKPYVPTTHASQIVASLRPNFGVLGKVPSFGQFGAALTANC